ncbi:MAG: porin family protein [Rikenellaceae bacterium]
MKRVLLIVIAFLTISASANAGDGFYWGPKFGIGISNLSGKINSSFRGAFDVGLAVGYDSGFLGLEAAAMFKIGGATVGENMPIGDNNFFEGKAKARNYYFSVPLTAKLFLTKHLFLNAGPQFDFLLGERIGNDNVVYKSTDLYKSMTISGLVGVGYQFGFGLGVAFNYNIGFTNALKGVAKDVFNEVRNPKNQNMGLVFSYRF